MTPSNPTPAVEVPTPAGGVAVKPVDASAIRDGRLEFLDALRGIAALAVLLEHTFGYIYPPFNVWSGKYFDLGQFGVVSFFLVSGFIIPISLERAGSLRSFWLNRFFRLYPIYWFSLLVAAGMALFGYFEFSPAFNVHPVRSLLANVTMLQFFLRVPDALPNYWTLGMELLFYLLCSALFLTGWLPRSLLWAWTAAIGMLALVSVAGFGLHRSLPAGRIGLIVTAFFGTVLFSIHWKRLSSKVLILLLPAVALPLFVGLYFRFYKYPVGEKDYNFGLCAVLTSWSLPYILFAVLYLLRRHDFPQWSIWLGRISYSLYLIGALVLYIVTHLVSNSFAILLLTLVASIGISWVTYTWIEKPAVAFHKARSKKKNALAH